MPIYNHSSNCERAILSIINQTYTDWELILLDNASEDPAIMKLITLYQEKDARVKGFRIEKNVGWPKGVALCLEKASGIYMGFLAADDFLEQDGLQNVVDAVGKNIPKVIWMGNKEDFSSTGKTFDVCPMEHYFTNELDICLNLVDFFNTVYYNAMHHFVDLKFLRENYIDFFSPFYSDCGSMTRALGITDNMMILPLSPYHLTRGTSHSTSKYLMHCYDMFIGQFNDIQEKLFRVGYFDLALLQYISKRFENNHLSNINNLCLGGACQDKLFDAVTLNWNERLLEIESSLYANGMDAIVYYYNSNEFFARIEDSLLILVNNALQENISIEDLVKDCHYLGDIILAVFSVKDNKACKKSSLDLDDLTRLFIAVLNKDNRLLFGYNYINFLVLNADQSIIDIFSTTLPIVKNKYARFLENVLLTSLIGYNQNRGIIDSYSIAYSNHCNDIVHSIEDLCPQYKFKPQSNELIIQLIQGDFTNENN